MLIGTSVGDPAASNISPCSGYSCFHSYVKAILSMLKHQQVAFNYGPEPEIPIQPAHWPHEDSGICVWIIKENVKDVQLVFVMKGPVLINWVDFQWVDNLEGWENLRNPN